MKPDRANSALVTTGGRSPPKGSIRWKSAGGIRLRASPSGVAQRSTLSTSPSIDIRYPTTPCSPGGRPLAIEVRAVEVVDGATVLIGPPSSTPQIVGASAARGWSCCHPSPSMTRRTVDRSASATGRGTQSGTSSGGCCTAAATFVTQGPV